MPRYLFLGSYSTEGIQALVHNPQNREEVARSVVEAAGGRLVSFDYAFGEWDVVAIADLPDGTSAVTVSMASSTAGVFASFKTTPLISANEVVEAMRRAGRIPVRPPTA